MLDFREFMLHFRKKIRGEKPNSKISAQKSQNLRTSGPTPVARGGSESRAPETTLAAWVLASSVCAGRFLALCFESRWQQFWQFLNDFHGFVCENLHVHMKILDFLSTKC